MVYNPLLYRTEAPDPGSTILPSIVFAVDRLCRRSTFAVDRPATLDPSRSAQVRFLRIYADESRVPSARTARSGRSGRNGLFRCASGGLTPSLWPERVWAQQQQGPGAVTETAEGQARRKPPKEGAPEGGSPRRRRADRVTGLCVTRLNSIYIRIYYIIYTGASAGRPSLRVGSS